jgi:hypothetical protein
MVARCPNSWYIAYFIIIYVMFFSLRVSLPSFSHISVTTTSRYLIRANHDVCVNDYWTQSNKATKQQHSTHILPSHRETNTIRSYYLYVDCSVSQSSIEMNKVTQYLLVVSFNLSILCVTGQLTVFEFDCR